MKDWARSDLNSDVTVLAELNVLYFTFIEIILDCPRVTITVMWLYYQGDHKTRFDYTQCLSSVYDFRYFDNYIEGELVMFRHKTLPYEVHTFQRRCNGHAACHCIIAIRSGDDVIVIDSCGPAETPKSRTPQIEVRLYLNGDLTPGTKIEQYNGGREYKVSVFISYVAFKAS